MTPAAPLLAYVDPGIAGMLYQIIAIVAGSVVALFLGIRTFAKTRLFDRFRSKKKKPSLNCSTKRLLREMPLATMGRLNSSTKKILSNTWAGALPTG